MNNADELAKGLVFEAIDQVNDSGLLAAPLEKRPDFPLSSSLDSLGVVNFVTTLEELCERRIGAPIDVANATYGDPSALETVSGLISALARVLADRETR